MTPMMPTHLPECAVPWIRECICAELHLCEQRMRDGFHPRAIWDDGHTHGERDTYAAAREVIVTFSRNHNHTSPHCTYCAATVDALLALDTLQTSQI